MIDGIHQSTINTAFRCGEQFRRRYVNGEILPPGIAAGRGTGVHKANEINLKQKIQTGMDMAVSDLKDVARDAYVEAFSNGVYLPKDQVSEKSKLLNEGLNDALRCVEVYREKVAETIRPIAIEEPFEIDVGLDLPLKGRMDYQEEPKVGDLKTSIRTWPKGRAQKEAQPIFYSLVHEKTRGVRPVFQYDILIARRNKAGEPTSAEHQTEIVNPTDAQYIALLHRLEAFLKMLKAGIFPPANQTDWWCDPKWCGYWYTCPYVGNNYQKNWV